MTGKVHKEAYHCLDRNQIILLSILMAFADKTGLVNIADGFIMDMIGLNQKEFDHASNFLLEAEDIGGWCSGVAIERTGWYADFECQYFTTGRFYITWDSGRLNQHQWKKLKAEVFERDDYTCTYCGERGGKLEGDHQHPVSRGGSNDIDNIVTACIECNRLKGNKTVEEWLGESSVV